MVKRLMPGRNDVRVIPAQARFAGLFDCISSAFETCGARPAECGLLLLRGRLLLLLGLLAGCCILAAALPARGSRTDRGTGAGIPADDLAHYRAARGATQAGAGGRAGCSCRLFRGGLRRRRLRRIEARLLDRPRMAGRLVALLLLWRLPLRRINILLGDRRRYRRSSQCKHPKNSAVHGFPTAEIWA